MSNKALTWAFARTGLKAGPKFVLVALADMADQEHSCYPGVPMLSELTGLSLSGVRAQLELLLARNLITRERRHRKNGSRSSNRYYLAVDKPATSENLPPESGGRDHGSKRQNLAEGLAPDSGRPIARIWGGMLEPSVNPKINTESSGPTQVTGPVDNFDDDDDGVSHPPTRRAVNLNRSTLDTTALAAAVGQVLAVTGIDTEQLGQLGGIILGRSKYVVADPTSYVIAAIRADPFEWQSRAFELVASADLLGGNRF